MSHAMLPDASSEGQRRSVRRKRWVIALSVLLVVLLALGSAAAIVWSKYGERISLELGWTTNDYEGDGHAHHLGG